MPKRTERKGWLPVYGAVVATLSLAWQGFQYLHRHPVLTIECARAIGLISIEHGPPTARYIVRFANVGPVPVSLYNIRASVQYDSDDLFGPMPPEKHGYRIEMDGVQNGVRIPFKLSEGEVQSLVFQSKIFEFAQEPIEGEHHATCSVLAQTTDGEHEVNTPITVIYTRMSKESASQLPIWRDLDRGR